MDVQRLMGRNLVFTCFTNPGNLAKNTLVLRVRCVWRCALKKDIVTECGRAFPACLRVIRLSSASVSTGVAKRAAEGDIEAHDAADVPKRD